MNTENIVFWLRGFLEGKETLTIDEIKRMKEVIGVPTNNPSYEQVDKMITELFPHINGMEKTKMILDYCSKPSSVCK